MSNKQKLFALVHSHVVEPLIQSQTGLHLILLNMSFCLLIRCYFCHSCKSTFELVYEVVSSYVCFFILNNFELLGIDPYSTVGCMINSEPTIFICGVQSRNMYVRCTERSPFPIGLHVSVTGCLSLFVSMWPCKKMVCHPAFVL